MTQVEKYKHYAIRNFLIAMMKFISAVFCEVIMIIMIAHVQAINDIIKDFVAIGFIVEIDDYFAANLNKKQEWEEKIDEYN
jgi:hypothetical protein